MSSEFSNAHSLGIGFIPVRTTAGTFGNCQDDRACLIDSGNRSAGLAVAV